MTKVLKLASAFLHEHPVRLLLTTLATATAVCMVVWVTSGYEALHKTYDEYASLAFGRYELAIAPISMNAADSIPLEALHDLRNDPAIAVADPMWAKRLRVRMKVAASDKTTNSNALSDEAGSSTLLNAQTKPDSRSSSTQGRFPSGPGAGPNARLPEMLFLATDASKPPFEMLQGEWVAAAPTDVRGVVVRADVAKRRQLSLNDEMIVELDQSNSVGEATIRLRVTGIVNAPSLAGAGAASIPILSPSSGEAFISLTLADQLFGEPRRISLLGIGLANETDITRFRFGWAPKLGRYATPVQFQEAYEVEEALDQAAEAQNVRLQAYSATAVAMLVALLVTSCTLSMGVTERTRQYAVLRAVVLTRAQVGALIAIEGLFLGTLGFLGGILLGWIILQGVAATYSKLLHHGVAFGTTSLLLAAIAAFGGALFAAIIPAYRATRVRPLDAMAPPQQLSVESKLSLKLMVIGLALIVINPLLTFSISHTEQTVLISLVVGFATMTIGFILLAPAIVMFVDRCVGALLARLFAVDPKLLSSQITAHLWRTVGAAISMAFGMGLFIGIQVWGFTMLQAFMPGDWVPDAIVTFDSGLPLDSVPYLAALPEIDEQQCLPLVVEQPRLLNDLTGSAERASVTRQDNIVLVGLDPVGAFGGTSPFLQVEWVAGNPQEAIRQMQQGRACVVPDHFLDETGLKAGDTITLVPPEDAEHPVQYTIAGAVRMPGWHWQTKLTGMRPRTHRAAALVLAGYSHVAEDFDMPRASHVWFSYPSGQQISTDQVNKSIQSLYDEKRLPSLEESAGPGFRVIPVQGIRDHLQGIAQRWIWIISQVPLIALLISSLGVLNVLVASVRSRRWEFGVLRSIGFTSSHLARAILVEGLLIAFVACLLSLSFGVLAGWCGCGMAQHVSFFGGLHPPLIIPWLAIALGMILVLLLGLMSAVWPAISIRNTRPLKLLQAGADSF